MKNTNIDKKSNNTTSNLIQLANSIEKENAEKQRSLINKYSPYSDKVNQCISTYSELRFYCTLGLIESKVTRLSLIRKIDPELKVTCKGKRNIDLMAEGNPPYAYDSEEGQIELHHIGQSPDAPFAELTRDEHVMRGNNKKLHKSTQESWRKDHNVESVYDKERAAYWKKRAQGDIEKLRERVNDLPVYEELEDNFLSSQQIQQTLSRIYAESPSPFLYFLSDSTKTYALLKELGPRTFTDFISQANNDHKIQCTHCDSEDYRLYGKYNSNGEEIQRYKCKQCGQTFTSINNSIVSDSKLSFVTWITFIDCLYRGLSVEMTAKLCNISAKSVHNNRLRLFYALKVLDDNIKLRGKIVMDETYFLASFKGNRTLQKDFSLDRKPRKRGSENQTNGLSKEYVCVECALDEYGNSVARVAGLGAPNYYKIQCAMQDSIDQESLSCIYADGEHALTKYANTNGYPIKQITTSKKKIKYDADTAEIRRWIQKMNSFHSRLKKFMSKFSGVSSDLLCGYLYLFTWIDRNRGNENIEAYKELFSVMVQPNLYRTLDEISSIFTFYDIVTPKRPKNRKPKFQDFDRAQEIFDRYADGEGVTQLSREYNLSRTRLYNIINKYRAMGYGYKTEKEKQEEAKVDVPFEIPYPYKTVERNKQIYAERLAWRGSAKTFYKRAAIRHNLSVQTIKNIISIEKRVASLQDPICVNQYFEHKNLIETYQEIYSRFLCLTEGGMGRCKSVETLAHEYGYVEVTIWTIINKFEKANLSLDDLSKKRKIAKIESQTRDSAIFADFLRWDGTRATFCTWAAEKYNLSISSIYHILKYSCMAVPKRYEMTYEYPTQRKV